jgi:hypothetical protein
LKLSSTGSWQYYPLIARDIAAGDMNGDGRDDLVGTIDGDGVYYIDSVTYASVKFSGPADLVAAGDIDGDGTDDLVAAYASQGGVWARHSSTGSWELIANLPVSLDMGNLSSGAAASIGGLMSPPEPVTGVQGLVPGTMESYVDLSIYGPGGYLFTYDAQPNLAPDKAKARKIIPGPGDHGFEAEKQDNLVPGKGRGGKLRK